MPAGYISLLERLGPGGVQQRSDQMTSFWGGAGKGEVGIKKSIDPTIDQSIQKTILYPNTPIHLSIHSSTYPSSKDPFDQSTSNHTSMHPSIQPSIYQIIHPPRYLPILPPNRLSIHIPYHPWIHHEPTTHPSSIYKYIHPPMHPLIHLHIPPLIHQPIIHLSTNKSFHP